MMRYLSVCSGIEAATVAWHGLGWQPAAFSEIDPFPCAVLDYHYPHVPLHGDFTTIRKGHYGKLGLIVGGTPCQAFSVAGLRKGLDDPRGNLTLGFVQLLAREQPRWVVWENVPGVLSIDGGGVFGTFLEGLAQCGYGFAYRVLDAQYFGVPQRRRRVFVVGYLGDWRRAAAVLFERESLRGDLTPRREAQQEITPTLRSDSANDSRGRGARSGDSKDELIVPVVGTLGARSLRSLRSLRSIGAQDADLGGGHLIAGTLEASAGRTRGAGTAPSMIVHAPGISPALKARDHKGPSSDGDGDGAPLIAHSLRAEGFDASEDGTGRGTPLVASFKPGQSAASRGIGYDTHLAPSLEAGGGGNNRPAVMAAMSVRRLTPRECERLQGFPDDYTLVPYRNKLADFCPDGPRYKALGNSMAVPVMRWLGERIALVDSIPSLPEHYF